MIETTHAAGERITIARVSGTVWRYATRLANPANGHADFDEGVAQLRAITTDAHLLAHGTTGSGRWYHDEARELLLAAGADPAAMDEVRALVDRRQGSGDLIAQLADQLNAGPRARMPAVNPNAASADSDQSAGLVRLPSPAAKEEPLP